VNDSDADSDVYGLPLSTPAGCVPGPDSATARKETFTEIFTKKETFDTSLFTTSTARGRGRRLGDV
jgi:hypothetical protein